MKKILIIILLVLIIFLWPKNFVLADEVDDSSTGIAEELFYEGVKDNVMGWTTDLRTGDNGAWDHYCIIRFEMPDLEGTITKVVLKQKVKAITGSVGDARVYKILRDDWVEGEATWNSYKLGFAWTIGGAQGDGTDIDQTIIDEVAVPSVNNWQELVLLGEGSDNPMTIDWGDQVNLLIRNSVEVGNNHTTYYARTSDANNHYLEVTYVLGATEYNIIGSVPVRDLDQLVKTNYWFLGIFCFMFSVSILWRK